jgi:hypothetical protein
MYYCSIVKKDLNDEKIKLFYNNEVLVFSDNAEHEKIIYLDKKKHPVELSFIFSLKDLIKNDCFYFLDLNDFENYQKYVDLKDKAVSDNYFFLSEELGNISNVFCNLKDRANFISKFGENHKYKFPLIIKGSLLKEIIEYINVLINYDVFYFQIEIILAVIGKIIND